jgi:hypothetical protein
LRAAHIKKRPGNNWPAFRGQKPRFLAARLELQVGALSESAFGDFQPIN